MRRGDHVSAIKERPILFSAPMVRAIREGRKTVTRRIVKPWQEPKREDDGTWFAVAQRDRRYGFGVSGDDAGECARALAQSGCCPYGSAGERLWVRETHFINDYREAKVPEAERVGTEIVYRADPLPCWEGEESEIRWRPSIFMPRWASRILLEITDVRVEQLQDISDSQIKCEGIDLDALTDGEDRYDMCHSGSSAEGRPTLRTAWRDLWQSLNGPGSWDANPWVWVVEFKRVA
jgi:hypothetical protein